MQQTFTLGKSSDMRINIAWLLSLLSVAVVSSVVTSRFVSAQNSAEPQLNLTHIGVNVTDIDAAVEYYKKVIGLTELTRRSDDAGNIELVFFGLGENTRLELNPATPDNPPGLGHFGVNVADIAAARDLYSSRGAEVTDIITVGSGTQIAYVTGPNGAIMELLQVAR